MTTIASTPASETYPHYAAAYAAQPASVSPVMRAMRDRGWEAFNRIGLPTARRGNEPWKYTNAGPIARETFSFADLASCGEAGPTQAEVQAVAPWQPDWRTLVVVDGVFIPGLSSENGDGTGIATSLADAMQFDAELGESVLGRLADPEDDGFAALNTAFAGNGVGISVPAGTDAGVINVVYVTTEREQPRATHPRLVISAAPNSRATVIETFVGPDARYLTNAVMEASVGEGASVEHYRLLLEGQEAYHVGVSRVLQQKDSAFSSVAIAHGAAIGRNDFGVTLAGTGAECALNGLYLTTGNQHIDNYINIDHAEPYGTSRLFYKGILDGRSRAVFGGNVTVRKDAQKTDAQQTDKNLLLSEEAEVDSKPSLLIYADDVKCGHGATAGHVDADTVFYMRSRGLDLATASRILIHAFASEIIDTVALEPLREYLDERFRNAIPSANIALPIGGRS
ncbi:MAG: Fe-S cluster assembly protein SufD [Chloroflexota bacterium]|nr:Fe-S cluster assembly protein SufD [Chloroflexota bacterium]MDE2960802.1 Fe-S cluster assembly protein SufD [Chloroflexota bacterium]